MELRNGKVIQEEEKEETGKKQTGKKKTDKKQPAKDKEEGVKKAPTGSGGGGGATKKQTSKTEPKPKPTPKPAAPATTTQKKQPAKKKPPAREESWESEDEEDWEEPVPARPVKKQLANKQPEKGKEVGEEAPTGPKKQSKPTSKPKPAALAMGVCGLCLGCSQTPDEEVDGRFKHSRESSPLAEVRKDVENFHQLLESHFHADTKKFVGQDGKGWMTTNRFMGLLNDHLFKPVPGSRQTYYALYVLYYAGHGSKTDGSFEVERGQVVTLDAVLNAWEQSAPYKANVSKLLIVADSCFSGKLVAELRKRASGRVTRMTDAARTVAIQATCGPNEVAWDGHYIPAYLHHVDKTQRIMQRQLSIIADSQLTKQRPVFYCPWGGGEISTGTKGKPIPLFMKGS